MAKRPLKRYPHVCECTNHAWVPLSQWGITMVSPQDAWLLLQRAWTLNWPRGARVAYASLLHRRVMSAADGVVVDHENHNGLDNRRENLRIATASLNTANARKNRGAKSRFKGVSPRFRGHGTAWRAFISLPGDYLKYLGTHPTEEDAARAYDAAAIDQFGVEFAATNVKLGLLPP